LRPAAAAPRPVPPLHGGGFGFRARPSSAPGAAVWPSRSKPNACHRQPHSTAASAAADASDPGHCWPPAAAQLPVPRTRLPAGRAAPARRAGRADGRFQGVAAGRGWRAGAGGGAWN
jgi:hypothetical protein